MIQVKNPLGFPSLIKNPLSGSVVLILVWEDFLNFTATPTFLAFNSFFRVRSDPLGQLSQFIP